MKKTLIVCVILLLLLLSIVSYFLIKNNFNLTTEEKVKKMMNKLSLDEKIGQMLMIYYSSDTYDEMLNDTITTYEPGGFILMSENINKYKDLQKFIDLLQENSDIPMFISIDEEGGSVQRLKNLSDKEITDIPFMEDVGKTNDLTYAYDIGKIIGKELNVFGINMNYAPVIDINSNPLNKVINKRSFGDNAELVGNMGVSLAKGLKDENIISVYKHFPGHGDTNVDPHRDLPILNKTIEELQELELIPFVQAIENDADVIMIGHFSVPSISKDNTPSSLSKEIVNDLLKEKLGYNGLVITDALNMGAITNHYNTEEIVTKTINAGVDILLMPGKTSEVFNIIKEKILNNEITEERINESAEKILTLKYKYNLDKKRKNNDASVLNSKEHQEIIKR